MATNIFRRAEDESVKEILEDPTIGHQAAAEALGTSDASVRRYRSRHGITLQDPIPGLNTEALKEPTTVQGRIEVDSAGATINNVVVESPILEDWGPVFRLFNLDADKFEVVDDTVRMSTWQQSKRTDDGSRDTVQLYSYSARFRKISADYVAPATVDRWREALFVREPAPAGPLLPGKGTYPLLVADPQLGKKGTEEAVENWKRGVRKHLESAFVLGPERIHIAFMGDEHEGALHNYPNQPHTIEMNFSRQLELDYDMRVWTIREAAALGVPLSVSSVISNHGEWTRNANKDVLTTRNDNSSTHIARQVKKMFDEMAPYTGLNIDWTIGDGAPGIVLDLSGVKAYFSHGYVEKGRGATTEARMKNAIEGQILGNTELMGDVQVYYMAHYHHFYSNTFADRTMFGCPALEATKSSEYMLEMYGVWSPAGMLGMLVGADQGSQGWSDLNVF